MKKIIIAIITTISVSAASEPFYGFEAGTYIYPDSKIGVIDLNLGYRINFLIFKNEVYGGTRNYLVWGEFNRDSVFDAYPFRSIYTIGNRLYVGEKWSIQIEHFCSHKVMSAHNESMKSIKDSVWYRNVGKRQTTTYLSLSYKSK